MILGYKPQQGPGTDAYWFGKVVSPDGRSSADKKFIRVVAGVALPLQDRIAGAVVVLGELYRSFGPQDLTGLAAAVGSWTEIENALTQYRRDLKFDHVICEVEEYRPTLWRIPGLTHGLGEVPCITYAAPPEALTEIGRSKVDQMLGEGRLHLELVKDALDLEPEMGARALQCAVVYCQEFKPLYAAPKKGEIQRTWLLGTTGL